MREFSVLLDHYMRESRSELKWIGSGMYYTGRQSGDRLCWEKSPEGWLVSFSPFCGETYQALIYTENLLMWMYNRTF
jgi:hypothetical protein